MATENTESKKEAIIAYYTPLAVGVKKKNIDRLALPAKVKLSQLTYRGLELNTKLGEAGIGKRIEALNNNLSILRNEIIDRENKEAKKDAELDDQTGGVGKGGVTEYSQNLFALKLNRTISNAAKPDKVIPVCKENKVIITEQENNSYELNGTKPRPLMIAALLNELLSQIGSKPKSYQEEEEKSKDEQKQITADEKRETKRRLVRNSKWRKMAFSDLEENKTPEPVVITKVKKEIPVEIETNKAVSEGEIRRRRVIGEAGTEIEEIEKLEKSLGENEQFSRALSNRKSKLTQMMSNLGKIEIKDKEKIELNTHNTEFQDLINEFLNVKEPPSKEEHDKKQREYDAYFNDPFVEEQIRRQQTEGILYDYNQQWNVIEENQRKLDRMQVEDNISKQVDSIREINEEIVNTGIKRKKEEEQEKARQEAIAAAKPTAEVILQRNLAADAHDQTINYFAKKYQDELDYKRMLKRSGAAYAEVIYQYQLADKALKEITKKAEEELKKEKYQQDILKAAHNEAEAFMLNNITAQAIAETRESLRRKYEQELEELKELKRAGKIQAEMLLQKNLVAQAIDEVKYELERNIKHAKYIEEIAPSVRSEANRLLIQNLALTAVDEVVDSIKKEYNKEQEERNKLLHDAKYQAERILVNNLTVDAINEATDSYAKDSGLYRKKKMNEAIALGKKTVEKNSIINSAKVEARRIQRVKDKKMIQEGADQAANNLYIKGLKVDAEQIANKLFKKKLAEAGNDQANKLFTEEIKQLGREEAEIINLKRLKEMAAEEAKNLAAKMKKVYDITDVNNRYLRLYANSRGLIVNQNLVNKCRKQYSKKESKNDTENLIESLMGQLADLNLGEETQGRKMAA